MALSSHWTMVLLTTGGKGSATRQLTPILSASGDSRPDPATEGTEFSA
jgi:hypothetical protein